MCTWKMEDTRYSVVAAAAGDFPVPIYHLQQTQLADNFHTIQDNSQTESLEQYPNKPWPQHQLSVPHVL